MLLLHDLPLHNTTQTRPNHKKAETDNFLGTEFQCSHQKTIHRLRRYDKNETSELQPSQRRDKWRGNLANAQAHAHTLSHCKGVDFRSRRRHRCLRFCILQIIGKRSQLDSVRSQFFWGMLDNMENSIEEVQTGPWRTELLRECTKGSLVPLVQSAKDFNKLQWYRSGN